MSPELTIPNSTVSVIIPTWNRQNVLSRAIHSVQSQSYPASEIIVVDDGSSDQTRELVTEKFGDVILLQQSNSGVSSARNRGIRQAKGQWIALLDSDDEWLPNKLELQLAALSSTANSRLIHCDEIWIRNGVRVNAMKKHQKYGGWIYPYCLPLCAISPSAALIRRDVFDDIGYFDESLPACEDYDFWLRFCASEQVTYIDQSLLRKYGGHPDQLSSKHWGMDRFRMYALAKAIESGTLNENYLQLTRVQLKTKLSIFQQGARKRDNVDMANELEKRYRHLTQ